MTKLEIIEKWEKEIVYSKEMQKRFAFDENYIHANNNKDRANTISACLSDLKKLNEAIVSEEKKCNVFFPDYMSTSQTKCTMCGKEKIEHF